MKSLFTIHAGEYLTGAYIEEKLSNKEHSYNVWVPGRDTGVDLLVTNSDNTKMCSLQVKYTKDYYLTLGNADAKFRSNLTTCGWWTLDSNKIAASKADFWVLMLLPFDNKNPQFIIITPQELLKRLTEIHGNSSKQNTYLWITNDKNGPRCIETRGLKKAEKEAVFTDGESPEKSTRDFTEFLNNWKTIQEKLK
jgi:hypothetical protein